MAAWNETYIESLSRQYLPTADALLTTGGTALNGALIGLPLAVGDALGVAGSFRELQAANPEAVTIGHLGSAFILLLVASNLLEQRSQRAKQVVIVRNSELSRQAAADAERVRLQEMREGQKWAEWDFTWWAQQDAERLTLDERTFGAQVAAALTTQRAAAIESARAAYPNYFDHEALRRRDWPEQFVKARLDPPEVRVRFEIPGTTEPSYVELYEQRRVSDIEECSEFEQIKKAAISRRRSAFGLHQELEQHRLIREAEEREVQQRQSRQRVVNLDDLVPRDRHPRTTRADST